MFDVNSAYQPNEAGTRIDSYPLTFYNDHPCIAGGYSMCEGACDLVDSTAQNTGVYLSPVAFSELAYDYSETELKLYSALGAVFAAL